jgi:hypothetical protein
MVYCASEICVQHIKNERLGTRSLVLGQVSIDVETSPGSTVLATA